jgi:hypothetical protein
MGQRWVTDFKGIWKGLGFPLFVMWGWKGGQDLEGLWSSQSAVPAIGIYLNHFLSFYSPCIGVVKIFSQYQIKWWWQQCFQRADCRKSTCSPKMAISQGEKCPISFPRDTCLHQNLCGETYSSHWQQKSYKTWRPTRLGALPDFGPHRRPLHAAFSFTFLQIEIPLIVACTPAFDFYPSAEQGPSASENSSVSSGNYKGTLFHLRLVQVAPNWRRLPRKWQWSSGPLVESALQESTSTKA